MNKVVVIGNGIDWLDSCYAGMKDANVFYTNKRIPLDAHNKFINFLIRCWFSVRNRDHLVIKLPLRFLWYRFSDFRDFVSKEDNIKFILYDHNRLSLDEKYISWLRKKYTHCKIAYVFTNIASKSGAGDYHMLEKLNEMYDYVFAFDEADAKKYGYNYNYLIYQPELPEIPATMEYDCLFVGGAKERLNMLHRIYSRLKYLGLRPCFYIFGVAEDQQLKDSDIHYNERIPYTYTMELTAKSKCIIDILQDGSTGIALRICESVVWNKLIITDNAGVINEPFYSDNNICVIKDVEEINKDFFDHIPNVNPNYKYLFSPQRLFKMIV